MQPAEVRKATGLFFPRIRFELLSSRRALSIVAENYFIIARSTGSECFRERQRGERKRERERGLSAGQDCVQTRRNERAEAARFRDLLISRKKTRGPSKNAAATKLGVKIEKYRTEVMPFRIAPLT